MIATYELRRELSTEGCDLEVMVRGLAHRAPDIIKVGKCLGLPCLGLPRIAGAQRHLDLAVWANPNRSGLVSNRDEQHQAHRLIGQIGWDALSEVMNGGAVAADR